MLDDLPVEMILKIIYSLNHIDIINLYKVSINLKNIVDKNVPNIYNSIYNEQIDINFKIFSKIYFDNIKMKKQSLIVILYIHKWLETELLDGPMERSILPESMKKATNIFLTNIFPEKKNEIFDTMLNSFNGWHRGLKKCIEKYISSDLLDNINMSRIVVDGFRLCDIFDYDNPKIMIYNKNFTLKEKYKIKINNYDTKIFPNL